jgi:hypothetical protein
MGTIDTHTTIEELLVAVFSVRAVPRLFNENQLQLRVSRERETVGRESVVRSEKPVAEAGDISGTQRKGNVLRWKPLPSSAVKTVTENTSLCVIMICKM